MRKKKFTFSKNTQEIIEKANKKGYLEDSDVRNFLENIMVPEDSYIMDTGSRYEANALIVLRLAKKIEKHPSIWKLFFEYFS